MTYVQIDPIIREWAKSRLLHLNKEFAGREARFCYWSNALGECFQISIQPPADGLARVDAWTVETSDDREAHQSWTAPVSDLRIILDTAFETVSGW